jgi:hypothetical protein
MHPMLRVLASNIIVPLGLGPNVSTVFPSGNLYLVETSVHAPTS